MQEGCPTAKMKIGGERLGRFLVTLLMACGLLLPCLFAMNIGAQALLALGVAFAAVAGLSLIAVSKKAALIGAGALIAALAALFLLTPGPNGALQTLVNSVLAVYLQLAGQPAALPLYAAPAAILFAAVFALLSFILCMKNAGFYSALTVGLVVLTVLWVTGRQELLLYFLPAVVALVILYAGSVHEELSIRRVLPVAAVLVALAYLLVPSGGVVSPALEKTAQEIRQTIFDYLFFTEPRNVFSLAAEGYYPNGASQLGGKAEPKNHQVMEVLTDKTVYLRGAVKDEYTGRTWLDSTGGRRYLYISPRYQVLRDSLFNRYLPSGEFGDSSLMEPQSVTVKMLSDSASTLFLPQRLRDLDTRSSGMVPYFNNATEVFITRDLAAGDTYRVSASLLRAGDPGVATFLQGAAEQAEPASADIHQRYTVLPDHLESQIFALADSIVGNNTMPYDKAMAIQTYLSHYYRYTLEPAPIEGNVDFVSYFLLRGKEGYCTYFASAMTVLCRMAGLPARYVEGYVARPDASGVALVTGLDAHAWTEVYFEGFGWLAFDATPARQQNQSPEQPNPPQDGQTPEPSPEPSPSPSQTPDESPDNEDEQDQNVPTPQPPADEDAPEEPPDQPDEKQPPSRAWIAWLLLLLLLGLAVLRVYLVVPENAAKRQKTLEKAYEVWIQAIFDAVYLKKIKKLPGETLIAYAERLDASHVMPAALTPVAQVLSHLKYSTHPVEKEYAALARETCLDIQRRMGFFKKLQFIFYRAITPKKRADYARRLS